MPVPEIRLAAIEKLRGVVRHGATTEALREIARTKLDILAPRRQRSGAGTPRRRASDATLQTTMNAMAADDGAERARAAYAASRPPWRPPAVDVLA